MANGLGRGLVFQVWIRSVTRAEAEPFFQATAPNTLPRLQVLLFNEEPIHSQITAIFQVTPMAEEPSITNSIPEVDILLIGSPGVGKATFLSLVPHTQAPTSLSQTS